MSMMSSHCHISLVDSLAITFVYTLTLCQDTPARERYHDNKQSLRVLLHVW